VVTYFTEPKMGQSYRLLVWPSAHTLIRSMTVQKGLDAMRRIFQQPTWLNPGASDVRAQTFLRYSDSGLCSFYRSTIRSPALLRDGIALHGEYNRGRSRFRSDNRHKTSAATGFVSEVYQ
jgi:hypothetical protein